MTINYNFNSELKITLQETTSKGTLALTPNGDVQLVTGKEKLATQMVRLIINDKFQFTQLNSPMVAERTLKSMLLVLLRQFKASQVDDINRTEDNLVGFSIFRKRYATTDNYVRVTPHPVTWRYYDTDVENGQDYEYQITKVYNGNFESSFTEHFIVTPTSFSNKQSYQIGSRAIVLNGYNQVTFYFDGRRYFKAAELLDKIVDVTASQNNIEPRKMDINIVVQDFDGNKNSVATGSYSLNVG